jgi:hypothetical protein
MFKKRGQGLSITTIIIAVIGLIILVVLIALLTGRLGGFSKGVEETGSCDVSCKAAGFDGAESTVGTATPGILDSEGNTCECTTNP